MKLQEILSQKIELSDLLGDSQPSEKQTKPFKVVQLCMQDFGGAGKAAYRLHKGLQSIGVDSTMVVLNKKKWRSERQSVARQLSRRDGELFRYSCL